MPSSASASASASSSSSSPFTAQHIAEWASFGPRLREKPTSPDQLAALKARKVQLTAMKQRLVRELNDEGQDGGGDIVGVDVGVDDDVGDVGDVRVWSTRAIERELDRLVDVHQRQTHKGTHTHSHSHTKNTPPPGNDNKIDNNDDTQESSRSPAAYSLDNDHPDNTLDHRSHPDAGPLLQYLWSTKDPLHGQTLYLGGEVGSDGNIYCIPGHAGQVLQIDTLRHTIQPIGPEELTSNNNSRLYKWLRGIVVGDLIYGLPCHADEILKINVKTHQVTKLPIPYDTFYHTDPVEAKAQREMIWKYHGGSICPLDNCIYAIPQAAHHVLKLDPATETISFVGPAFPGTCKWYGGVVGKQDGAIYGIPQNAAGVLRIAPDAVTTHGDYGTSNHKWHGGAAAANGCIVGVPANADTVLCITPAHPAPILEEIGNASTIQSGRHRRDGKYKYLGAMASDANGRVYIFPCASEHVLQVDTVHKVARTVGPNLRDTGMEHVHQNKWQNGLSCVQDQCVYGMPLSGHTLLRIDCSSTTTERTSPDPIVTTWTLPSPRIDCRDKFEGGVMTDSGVMYTVPNNHKGVLRIEPATLLQAPPQSQPRPQPHL